jgi:hypothetical protein
VNTSRISPRANTRFVLAALASLLVGHVASAQLLNGNFSGALSPWASFGDVGLAAGGGAFLTTASLDEDDFPAVAGQFNFSGTSAGLANVVGGLEDFGGLLIGALDLDPSNTAVEGSAIMQSFMVGAGDTLDFTYTFFTNEGVNPDYAFFAIDGVVTRFAGAADATTGSTPYSFETGSSFGPTHTFASAGLVTVVFGVVEVGDFLGSSALLLREVTLTAPIPEPASVASLAAGLSLGLVLLRRRARR